MSLSIVVIANESVNCDSAHSVGINSQADMNGKTFADVELQRGEDVVVQPQQMLNRTLSIPVSATDFATYMKYELAPGPPSLFDDLSMRSPPKAALSSRLLSLVPHGATDVPQNAVHTVDGGYLLHAVV